MTDCQNKSVTWKFVPDFGDYEVSEHGDLRRGTKHLKPERVQGSGRKRFPLSKDGRLYRISAHRLVALAFIGPKPFDGAEVCHRDGFIHNNHFSNLRWDTRSGNVVDAMRHKLTRVKRPRRGDRLAVACSEFLASKARRA